VVNNERVQNIIAQRVTSFLSEKLDNQVSVEHIRISRFNKVTLTNLCVTGLRGDTILKAPELVGRLGFFAFSSKNIKIRKVVLNNADIRLAIDPERDEINIKFIIDRLKSKDSTENKPRWIFGMQAIELNNCHFSFTNPTKSFDRPFGMNYANIDVTDLNLDISDFRLGDEEEGGVYFHIQKLSCTEKCGLVVESMSADFFVNRNNLSFKNVHIITQESEITAKDASFLFDSFKDFGSGRFVSKVKMSIDIQPSRVNFCDLSNFVPAFGLYSDYALVQGQVTGTIQNMKGKDVQIRAGEMTRILFDFDLKGLPDIRSTFIFTEIYDLLTCPSDIERIQLPRSKKGHVSLPETMLQLKTIGFTGNFTGFFDDFVTYGTFSTNLGNLSTDVSIKPSIDSKADTTFTFRGELKTENFHLGNLLQQTIIGEVTLNGMVEGSASDLGNIHASIEGLIKSIHLKGYNYKNIPVNGAINNRTYDGQLSIEEPNIKMDFSGKVDLTDPAVPAFDFWAEVERARLYHLRLNDTDTSSFAAFSIKGAFSGTNIDNIMGDLELKNSLIRRKSREIEINDLLLFTKAIRDTNRFILRSDILDAEIWGQYQFLKLPESFLSLVKNYAPAWGPRSINADSLSHNRFRFEAEFKDTEKLTHFFLDEFRVSRGTRLEGIYNPAQKDVQFVLKVPYMYLDGSHWRGLQVSGVTQDSIFSLEAGSEIFRINKNFSFENLTLLANARADSVTLDIRWNNWDSILNKGNLRSKIFFIAMPQRLVPSIHLFSEPGQIILSGETWGIAHQGISVDSTAVKINQFRALKDGQEILISGIISEREEDKLQINVKDLHLSALNSTLRFDQLALGGIANGTASLSNLYRVPVFVSDLHIEDFSLNGGLFGRTKLAARWNSFNRSVRIETESLLNDVRTLYVRGNYYIGNQNLDFDVQVERMSAKVIQPYIENIFTDIDGMLSARAKLTGTIAQPLLNGELELHRTALTLDYTKTRYNFSGVSQIANNSVLFNNIQIFDRSGNLTTLNGNITTKNFKDLSFDLLLRATNMEILNTQERDNNLFYGKAFASGSIRISGIPNDVKLDITAQTEKNTQFNIPLSSSGEVARTNFISFVDHTPRPKRPLYEFRRRRNTASAENETEPNQKMTINMSLDVTPDAEVQLIFDSKIGDIMKARGSGSLTFNISENRFDMSGSYVIEQGDYLFTLRNFINKKFTLEKGGVITWNGSPTDALVNLKAKYATKPPLGDLMGSYEGLANRSVPVECILHITNKLTDPNIRFDIQMPNAEQEARAFLSAATNSEEEMTRQFLSLLVINRFYADPNLADQTSGGSSGSSGLETMGMATASEFLTNQLSHMISQWSNNFDVDLSYYPGLESQNIGMDISTDTWNFHMGYEVGGMKTAESSSNVVGDFTFDTKLSKSGKLRFKAFNRSNEHYQFVQANYTQGLGILFREDFNSIKDLFGRKKKKKSESDTQHKKEEKQDDQDTDTTTPPIEE
jgi:hypothetical protein